MEGEGPLFSLLMGFEENMFAGYLAAFLVLETVFLSLSGTAATSEACLLYTSDAADDRFLV